MLNIFTDTVKILEPYALWKEQIMCECDNFTSPGGRSEAIGQRVRSESIDSGFCFL